jgi:hypothetical protein
VVFGKCSFEFPVLNNKNRFKYVISSVLQLIKLSILIQFIFFLNDFYWIRCITVFVDSFIFFTISIFVVVRKWIKNRKFKGTVSGAKHHQTNKQTNNPIQNNSTTSLTAGPVSTQIFTYYDDKDASHDLHISFLLTNCFLNDFYWIRCITVFVDSFIFFTISIFVVRKWIKNRKFKGTVSKDHLTLMTLGMKITQKFICIWIFVSLLIEKK